MSRVSDILLLFVFKRIRRGIGKVEEDDLLWSSYSREVILIQSYEFLIEVSDRKTFPLFLFK